VQYDQFISSVSGRTGLPPEGAGTLTHAALRVLADRISAGEADDLAARLPRELKGSLIPPTPDAQSFGPEEFARRVARSAGMPETDAYVGVAAVLATPARRRHPRGVRRRALAARPRVRCARRRSRMTSTAPTGHGTPWAPQPATSNAAEIT
jgi:uncharacterized protein (DUF2267 family)